MIWLKDEPGGRLHQGNRMAWSDVMANYQVFSIDPTRAEHFVLHYGIRVFSESSQAAFKHFCLTYDTLRQRDLGLTRARRLAFQSELARLKSAGSLSGIKALVKQLKQAKTHYHHSIKLCQQLNDPRFWEGSSASVRRWRADWQRCRHYAYYSSEDLAILGRSILPAFMGFVQTAEQELHRWPDSLILPEDRSIWREFSAYLQRLKAELSLEQTRLAQAMQIRLGLVSTMADTQFDDLMYTVAQGLADAGNGVGADLLDGEPRRELTSGDFQFFHEYIRQYGNQTTREKLSTLPWLNTTGPLHPFLSITPKQLKYPRWLFKGRNTRYVVFSDRQQVAELMLWIARLKANQIPTSLSALWALHQRISKHRRGLLPMIHRKTRRVLQDYLTLIQKTYDLALKEKLETAKTRYQQGCKTLDEACLTVLDPLIKSLQGEIKETANKTRQADYRELRRGYLALQLIIQITRGDGFNDSIPTATLFSKFHHALRVVCLNSPDQIKCVALQCMKKLTSKITTPDSPGFDFVKRCEQVFGGQHCLTIEKTHHIKQKQAYGVLQHVFHRSVPLDLSKETMIHWHGQDYPIDRPRALAYVSLLSVPLRHGLCERALAKYTGDNEAYVALFQACDPSAASVYALKRFTVLLEQKDYQGILNSEGLSLLPMRGSEQTERTACLTRHLATISLELQDEAFCQVLQQYGDVSHQSLVEVNRLRCLKQALHGDSSEAITVPKFSDYFDVLSYYGVHAYSELEVIYEAAITLFECAPRVPKSFDHLASHLSGDLLSCFLPKSLIDRFHALSKRRESESDRQRNLHTLTQALAKQDQSTLDNTLDLMLCERDYYQDLADHTRVKHYEQLFVSWITPLETAFVYAAKRSDHATQVVVQSVVRRLPDHPSAQRIQRLCRSTGMLPICFSRVLRLLSIYFHASDQRTLQLPKVCLDLIELDFFSQQECCEMQQLILYGLKKRAESPLKLPLQWLADRCSDSSTINHRLDNDVLFVEHDPMSQSTEQGEGLLHTAPTDPQYHQQLILTARLIKRLMRFAKQITTGDNNIALPTAAELNALPLSSKTRKQVRQLLHKIQQQKHTPVWQQALEPVQPALAFPVITLQRGNPQCQ